MMRYLYLLCLSVIGALFVNMAAPMLVIAPVRASNQAVLSYDSSSTDLNALLAGINRERIERGLSELALDTDLTNAANIRARDMALRQYYAHQSPEGTFYYDILESMSRNVGYNCENLDLRLSNDSDGFIGDWLESTAGHRECLLNPAVTRIGLASSVFKGSSSAAGTIDFTLVVAIHGN